MDKPMREKVNTSARQISSWFVLIHTTVYMFLYYGNSPTSGEYSHYLNIPYSMVGLLKAATPIAAFFATFAYSWIMGKKYIWSYIISWASLTIGALLYYLARTFDSVIMIIIGRMLIGCGGGRVITRSYFATQVPYKEMAVWSSLLVASTSLSLTCAPGISSVLEYIPSFSILGAHTEKFNIFSLMTFFICLVLGSLFFVFFLDMSPPSDIIVAFPSKNDPNEEEIEPRRILRDYSFEYSEVDCMEIPPNNEEKMKDEEEVDKNFDGIKSLNKAKMVYEYFQIVFVIAFFTINKSVQEGVVAESAQMMKTFYAWDSQSVGYLMLLFTPISRSSF